jgi:hypothetical protein
MRNAAQGIVHIPKNIRRQIHPADCQVGESQLRPVGTEAVLRLQELLALQNDNSDRVVGARQPVQIFSLDLLHATGELSLGAGPSRDSQVLCQQESR